MKEANIALLEKCLKESIKLAFEAMGSEADNLSFFSSNDKGENKMEFLNENKDKFEDCTKEQQKILACAAIDGELEFYWCDNDVWVDKEGYTLQGFSIYRTKPKTISLQEAYEQMEGLKPSTTYQYSHSDVYYAAISQCLAILERTEGFK